MENCAVALDADDDFHEVSPILSCGVYALVHRGVIVYIGQSKVMLGRIGNHRAQWGRKRGVASSAPAESFSTRCSSAPARRSS